MDVSTLKTGAPKTAEGRFRNNYRNDPHGGTSLLAFLRDMRTKPWQKPVFQRAENDPVWLTANRKEISITWIGHASFLIQAAGLNILTDPVLSKRSSPVQWAGPARIAPLGLEFDELPPVDVVLISHNHYDHLDANTVRKLVRRDAPEFIVPLGLADWFRQRGINEVRELDWWQSDHVFDALTVYAVPAQHYSGRTASDRNRSLWCGFVFEAAGQRFYFAGDTGYGPDFEEIGRRFSPIDVSLIPIGAYLPREFMRAVHVNPEEAVKIHLDVGSRRSIGMHWGTFRLTLEPLEEPPQKLKSALLAAGIEPQNFLVMQHGQTLRKEGLGAS